MPRMLFHIPYQIDSTRPSGAQIRPLKMLEAFGRLGYDVDAVMGYGEERKAKIEAIKKKMKSGMQYDFLYSESSSMPTLLTEKHHFPTYPFLDFSFFKFCKLRKMKIGLFYRDIYWRFGYHQGVAPPKRITGKFFYRYDLCKYNELVDVLFLPSKEMYEHFPVSFSGDIEDLPPGADPRNHQAEMKPEARMNELRIVYVGGIGGTHHCEKLFRAVAKREYLRLTVCCRKDVWDLARPLYSKFLNPRIELVHPSGDALVPYYEDAEVCSLFLEPVPYREFAMPIKLFEYLSFQRPIVATKGTAGGRFVEENRIGWTIQYDVDAFIRLTDEMMKDKNVLVQTMSRMLEVRERHTWEARARKVVKCLTPTP